MIDGKSPEFAAGLAPLSSFRGIVHHADGDKLIASRAHTLFASDDGGGSWQRISRLSSGIGPLNRFRLFQRLLREQIFHALPQDNGTLLVFLNGRVVTIDKASGGVTSERRFPHRRPLCVAQAGQNIYFGEYRSNPERSPVHVWRSRDHGQSWDIAWQFKNARHVHGVFHDSYSGDFWVTTGDEDAECGIYRTRDDFSSLQLVAGGSQTYRAVELLFDTDHVYFGGDSPFQPNALCRMRKEGEDPELLRQVDSSVFYAARVGGNFLFSTAAEPSEVNSADHADVWLSGDGKHWARILRFFKDAWPSLLHHGQVTFAAGPGDGEHIWLTPVATRGDNLSLKFRVAGLVGEPQIAPQGKESQ
jgi:hypothetical protein